MTTWDRPDVPWVLTWEPARHTPHGQDPVFTCRACGDRQPEAARAWNHQDRCPGRPTEPAPPSPTPALFPV